MADTELSDHSRSVIAGGRTPILRSMRTTGAGEFPGCIVALATSDPDVKLADADDATFSNNTNVLGVLKERSDTDIDSTFNDNTEVKVIMKGSGTVVWVPMVASRGAIVAGDRIYVSATAGYGRLAAAITVPSDTTTTYAAIIKLQGMEKTFLGIAMQDEPDTAAVDWVKVLI